MEPGLEKRKVNKMSDRTEEVTDIIERMPNTFARVITLIVCFIVVLILLLGFFVKYPDIVIGEVTVSAELAPVQLVTEQSGILKINNLKSQSSVDSGSVIAWIDNPANPVTIKRIRMLIASISSPTINVRKIYNQLPKDLNLGDLTLPYSSFLSSINQLADYQENHSFQNQEESLVGMLNEQEFALMTLRERELLSYKNLKITRKFLERDSILLARKIVSPAEFERTLSNRIHAEDQVQSSLRNSSTIREQIRSTRNTIQQTKIAKSEKELKLNLEVLTSYNNLIDKINSWEKQYLIKTPISGKVQFLKFWKDNQFIHAGEPIFSVVPKQNNTIGNVTVPINGAGKVKSGQEVILKLADFPYMEYGYLKGVVSDIAMVPSQTKLSDGKSSETYLVVVSFPNGLTTNYGTDLDFKFESKGTAEIITKDRRLIERLFDNLKYIGKTK